MVAISVKGDDAPDNLRLMLLAYGLENAYRVITLEEIAQSLRHFRKDEIRNGLDNLAGEGLLMKFAGRYCFNKAIPFEIRNDIERALTPSGTIRMNR
jgi:hypothetical protein